HRAQVREDAEPLAQREQAALGPLLRARVVPLRPAHGTEQHRARRLAVGERLVGERRPVAVDGAATHEPLGELELVAEALGDELQHLHRLGGDLGADAVPRQHDDLGLQLDLPATVSPYSMASTSARQLASMMLVLAPTVLQVSPPRCVSMSTRVIAPVPLVESRMRTL